ncbi:NlpC/P60 family protein [Kibdelosporangium philippinense]|uniref:NlpC/P60 family protein n=1 Tax=Kibdelosporangium philippinense TaxID=211113 RepID=A0ABS8ZKK6_9PSEU|nr:NlpC/P60 family protein [Kibdelosporangium philippinense]MCE7008326.1 NlpC/P60 family protein [Kibdelosporangium philippinense]
MKLAVFLSIAAVLVIAAILTAGAVTSVVSTQQNAQNIALASCNAAIGPITASGPQGQIDASKLNEEQRGTVSLIIGIGKERKLPPLAWQVAIQAGMTESGLRNLNYGDRDSLGIFQMRPSMGWGTEAQVTNPTYAVHKFYDVLEKVPNWKEQRPGESAQDVERSAFPDRYHKWEPMAAHLIGAAGQVQDPTGCGEGTGDLLPAASGKAATAIQFALAQQGKPYLWGAALTRQDAYDCSSLMNQAYRTAGIILPRVSRDQYRAGAHLPVEQAQPGDLVFWAWDTGNPVTIHHVAMYLGDGKIVEAQQTGVPVHIRPMSFTERGLMRQAVRPGV